MHVINKNKRALYDYNVLKTYEAGIVLTGLEVRTIKTRGINIQESFIRIEKNEPFLWNAYIGENSDKRKLLLHAQEIRELERHVKETGRTIVPLSVGIAGNGYIKVEIGAVVGKKKFDKRETEKAKSIAKELRRMV